MLLLSKKDIQACIDMKQAIALMKDAFAELSTGEGKVPVRHVLNNKSTETTALFMPASMPENKSLGLKVVGMNPQNIDKNLPFINAVILLLDTETGETLALMEASWITALRTGAGSGLATDYLARKDAETVAIFGAGVQARTQLEAVCAVRNIAKAKVINRTPQKAKAFADEMAEKLKIKVEPGNVDDLKDADIICTATTAYEPLFQHHQLKAGVHINAVGAYSPKMSEIPVETITASKLVIDRKDACLHEAGDIVKTIQAGLITEDDLNCELGEIAAGKKAGRVNDQEITVFKSVGSAAQDLVVARYIYKKALMLNLGTAFMF
ncbi:ornithine cyclodeaminase family protein [Chondrinema litorale]|uniref:ornithine cyclodeaminase family protein n=1 Tax=Chondrinema litorale TaxID=2994555 RepID=UPI002543A817|nr:hypothetical protein [Chondrinema litorale]UZR93356.1 hypothetical protein OQ292_15990 [Chondrinema litorale]